MCRDRSTEESKESLEGNDTDRTRQEWQISGRGELSLLYQMEIRLGCAGAEDTGLADSQPSKHGCPH